MYCIAGVKVKSNEGNVDNVNAVKVGFHPHKYTKEKVETMLK